MIDPHELGLLTTQDEKEYFILFALFVSGGKTAWVQKKKLDELLDLADNAHGIKTPLGKVRLLQSQGKLAYALQRVKVGQYNRLGRALAQVVGHYEWEWDRGAWTWIHGVGMKTASFITMYTQEDPGPIAVLDTWVLAWLKAQGYPIRHESTPASKRVYYAYEACFAAEARKRGMTVRELDQLVWRTQARREKKHAS